jgi:hypothetical protein
MKAGHRRSRPQVAVGLLEDFVKINAQDTINLPWLLRKRPSSIAELLIVLTPRGC